MELSSCKIAVDDARINWLRLSAPIFVQCLCDKEENGLVAVFVDFVENNSICVLNLIFQSEASFNIRNPTIENSFATLLYRSYNQAIYGRTADIKTLTMQNIDIFSRVPTSMKNLWSSIDSPDFAGNQSFTIADKLQCLYLGCYWHYDASYNRDIWELGAQERPRVYINTCNHEIGYLDNNSGLTKHVWHTYPLLVGNRAAAETYACECIETKPTCFEPIRKAFLACNPAEPDDSVCSVDVHDPTARYTDTRILATPKVKATYLHDPVLRHATLGVNCEVHPSKLQQPYKCYGVWSHELLLAGGEHDQFFNLCRTGSVLSVRQQNRDG